MLKRLLREFLKFRSSLDQAIFQSGLPFKYLISNDFVLLGHLSDVFEGEIMYLSQSQPHLFLDASDYIGQRL
jgi:hypothetical protein